MPLIPPKTGTQCITQSPHHHPQNALADYKFLRGCCWLAALALGAGCFWSSRFAMYPDGISYLDIGDAYWRGDWHNAISAYWSPLYSWIVGFFLKVIHPAIPWEYPLVQLVNFLIYVGALIAFDFFFCTFLEQQTTDRSQPSLHLQIGLPAWGWFVVGYCAFIVSSLFLITISFVSGDMLLASIVYVASALILRIHQGNSSWRMFALLGLVLGVGYLAKTAMFLMAFPFLAVAAMTQAGGRQKLRAAIIAVLFFFLAAGPFLVVLSITKRRPTFGDSGKINYTINVGRTQFFTPHEPTAKHPPRKLQALPEAYEYGSPIAGTYPLWYDPAYWHEGIEPRFSVWRQVRRLLLSIATCAWISFNVGMGLGITIAICFLYLVSNNIGENIARALQNWVLWVPALAGIGLYSLVVIEPRYVGALFCLLWLVAFRGVRLPASASSRRVITTVASVLAVLTCSTAVWQIAQHSTGSIFLIKEIGTPEYTKVAEAVIAHGIRPGDKIAIISDWLLPSRQGSYIARLARIHIIAEARQKQYWNADEGTRAKLLFEFFQAGAKAVLTYEPRKTERGWERLAGTDFYLYLPGKEN